MRMLGFGCCVTLMILALAGCGAHTVVVASGSSYALAPDLTVRLVSMHPSLNQLRLDITVLATGSTAIEALVPVVVVTPDGGRETSASLTVQGDEATMQMTLDDAQGVSFITVSDRRNGSSVRWSVPLASTLLGCKASANCGILAMPQSPALPAHP